MPRIQTLLAAALLAVPALAQGKQIAELERRLKRADLTAEARAELVDALLDLGPRGAIAVARATSAASKSLARTFERERRTFAKSFRKAADKMVAARSKGQSKEIEEIQQKARRISANRALSKDTIKQRLDPAVARLREMLTVSVDDVIYENTKLEAAHTDLLAKVELLADLHLEWDYALEVSSSGDAPVPQIARLQIPVDGNHLETSLRKELEFLAILATPMSASDETALRTNRDTRRAEIDDSAADGVLALNVLRLVLGRNALVIDVKLSAACADHSADMERLRFFSHESPVPGKRTFGQRAARFGASANSENIAQGQQVGPGAIRGWWYSPGHHRNMMGGHRGVGLGRSGTYWTQCFN